MKYVEVHQGTVYSPETALPLNALFRATPMLPAKERAPLPGPYRFHFIDGPEGVRTPDLLTASQARSQLRHRPGQNLIRVLDVYGGVNRGSRRVLLIHRAALDVSSSDSHSSSRCLAQRLS